MGLQTYLNEQLSAPISPYPDPSTTGFGLGQVQARFFVNAVHGQDQLRQRVAFALSQIFVASAVEENTPTQLVPYLQLLKNDAFVNFRQLMEDVTLSPTMGEYLDMRNNDKANPATDTRANENYARELMQLFTIGLSSSIRMAVCNWMRTAIRFPLTIRLRFRISPKFIPAGRIRPNRGRRSRNTTRRTSSDPWSLLRRTTTPLRRRC